MIGRLLCAAVMLAAVSGDALASRKSYCEAYARDAADHKTGHGGDVLFGTVAGALTGALIGAAIDDGKGAGQGAIIGGVGGTVLGAAATSQKWQRTYERSFDRCMARYEPPPAAKEEPVVVAGVESRHQYCEAKYRSYNRQTGTYLSLSGQLRPCR